MQASEKHILKLDNVSKIFRIKGDKFGRGKGEIKALDQVSLLVRQGEIFGLVGESGSGKTTCGRIVVGLETCDQGSIYLAQNNVTHLSSTQFKKYRSMVQMVFQDPYQSLNPQLSILDSVQEPLITHKIGNPHERQQMVISILDQVGLSPALDFIYRFPHQLSGGQRQRVAIARAMILGPSCLVADEPTSMLDASYSAQIFDILLGMRKQFQTSIIFITHSLAAARYLCDKVAVLYKGKVVEQGPCAQVIKDPIHPYTQALVDATPKFGRALDKNSFDALLTKPRPETEKGCVFFPRCKKALDHICQFKKPDFKNIGNDRFVSCFLSENE